MTDCSDPFREHRQRSGVLVCPFQGERVPMILGYKELRKAAKDWETYSNDAPFRVPIPSEENVRSVRQLPIETDPPDHTEFRAIAEPFFRSPTLPAYIARIEQLVRRQVDDAFGRKHLDIVREFALPLQSRALTVLLKVPESEAQEWIGWGTHVFRDGDGETKGPVMEHYIHRQLDRALDRPGDDFFSALTKATFRGRSLTREEMVGFANLAFAGGRDTIINAVTTVIAYIAEHPETLSFLREDPKRAITATEEFVRVISPLTHIGRVCKKATDVLGFPVAADGRVSLCWASANHDETIFPDPDTVKLDRMPNPHVGFGSGTHNCMGAPHARLLLRTLLNTLTSSNARISIQEAVPHVEHEVEYQRAVGYDRLVVTMRSMDDE
jgi:cytochrome P450